MEYLVLLFVIISIVSKVISSAKKQASPPSPPAQDAPRPEKPSAPAKDYLYPPVRVAQPDPQPARASFPSSASGPMEGDTRYWDRQISAVENAAVTYRHDHAEGWTSGLEPTAASVDLRRAVILKEILDPPVSRRLRRARAGAR